MSIDDFATLAKTLGIPGALVAGFMLWAARNGPSPKEDPSRSDVLAEIKALRKENAEENKAIRKEIDSLSREVTDRLARVETTVASHGRKLDR